MFFIEISDNAFVYICIIFFKCTYMAENNILKPWVSFVVNKQCIK